MIQILQIIPQLPPVINGLGDYAINLARQLRQDFGIETQFLVGDSNWTGTVYLEEFSVRQIAQRSVDNLVAELAHQPSTIVLHYVGYGYAKRGCPVWLVEGLERWKVHTFGARLVTMFHEPYASGSPWTSAFWLSMQQKQLASRLIQISNRCLTSRDDYAHKLHQLRPRQDIPISVSPVFSNIKEPKEILPLAKRQRRLIIFGHRNSRAKVYQQYLAALEQICQTLDIQEIYDIGIPIERSIYQINQIPVVEWGAIDNIEISRILQTSIAGFLAVPPADYLAKSGVFAAYCAHGMLSIVAVGAALIDGLQPESHYWTIDRTSKQLDLPLAQAIADRANHWYQSHNLSVHARVYAQCLNAQLSEAVSHE